MKKICLLIFLIIFSFVIIEIILRLAFLPPEMISVSENKYNLLKNKILNENVKNKLEDGNLFIETPNGRRLRPITKVEIKNHYLSKKNIIFYINSLGFRHKEIETKKQNEKRILFLGDSITFNDYLNDEETFIRLTENKINNYLCSNNKILKFEAINAGIGAIGLQNEYSILIENGLKIKPDIVIIGFYLNDYEMSDGIKMIKVPYFLQKSWTIQYIYKIISTIKYLLISKKNNPISLRNKKNIKTQIERELENKYFENPNEFEKLIIKNYSDWGSAWSENAWSVIEPMLLEIKRISCKNDFKLIVLCFPVKYQVELKCADNYPQNKLKVFCENNNINFIDILPDLKNISNKNQLFYDHCHLTPIGNKVVSDLIFNYLQKNNFF